jgi:hypothetical protein
MSGESRRAMLRFSELPGEFPLAVILPQSALEERRGRAIRRMRGRKSAARKSFRAIPRLAKISRVWPGNWALIGNNSATRPGQCRRRPSYLFSGSGCRAATTPPRAAAERLGRNAWFAGNLCAAARGATRRSATSSTALNRYSFSEEERERNPVACSKRIFCRTQLARRPCHQTILFPSLCAVGSDRNTRARRPCHYATTAVTLLTSFPKFRPPNSGSPCLCSASSPGL